MVFYDMIYATVGANELVAYDLPDNVVAIGSHFLTEDMVDVRKNKLVIYNNRDMWRSGYIYVFYKGDSNSDMTASCRGMLNSDQIGEIFKLNDALNVAWVDLNEIKLDMFYIITYNNSVELWVKGEDEDTVEHKILSASSNIRYLNKVTPIKGNGTGITFEVEDIINWR